MSVAVGSIVRIHDPRSERQPGRLVYGHVTEVHRGPISTRVRVEVAGTDVNVLLPLSAVEVSR